MHYAKCPSGVLLNATFVHILFMHIHVFCVVYLLKHRSVQNICIIIIEIFVNFLYALFYFHVFGYLFLNAAIFF